MTTIENSAQPQPVAAPLTSAAIFLVLTIRPGSEKPVRQLLPDLADLVKTVGFRDTDAQLTCVVGIGSYAWDRLFPGPRPAQLHPFHSVVGAKHTAPATPGDLLFHIRANRFDSCFALSNLLTERLRTVADIVDEVHGFRYFDARDLLGFVDGTANPTGNAATAATVIGGEDPLFQGGSYVTVQKYLHDLDHWNTLTVEEQEQIMGRTKLDNIELSDAEPSHVSLNTILDDDGEELEIVRDNMPFGRIGTREFGTYYIAYTKNPTIVEHMLEHMFIGDPPGTYDRLLDVSTAMTGNLFFVPSADFLDNPSILPTTENEHPAKISSPTDGSLAIGSLKRSNKS